MPSPLASPTSSQARAFGSTPETHEEVIIRSQDGRKITTVGTVLSWESDFFDGLLDSLGRTSSGSFNEISIDVDTKIFNETARLMARKNYGKIPLNWHNTVRQELVEEQLSFFAPRPYTAAIVASERAKAAVEAAARLIPKGFVRIEAGSFDMGSPAGEAGRSNNETLHRVSLTRPFFLQSTPVTQTQWQGSMGNNPSRFSSGSQAGSRPVETVSWYDAVAYCNKLSAKEGLSLCYELHNVVGSPGTENYHADVSLRVEGTGYHLPTEAQWEYAGRAGVTGATYAQAGQSLGDIAWYSENSNGTTHPVEGKALNAWGLQMLGNVSEWTEDRYRYGPYVPGANNAADEDPREPDAGVDRVIRGGSWCATASGVRLAGRFCQFAITRSDGLGFRPARSVPLVP
jgi:sulfatase modifying factor 1